MHKIKQCIMEGCVCTDAKLYHISFWENTELFGYIKPFSNYGESFDICAKCLEEIHLSTLEDKELRSLLTYFLLEN